MVCFACRTSSIIKGTFTEMPPSQRFLSYTLFIIYCLGNKPVRLSAPEIPQHNILKPRKLPEGQSWMKSLRILCWDLSFLISFSVTERETEHLHEVCRWHHIDWCHQCIQGKGCQSEGPDEWANRNFMKFTGDKCKALHLGWTNSLQRFRLGTACQRVAGLMEVCEKLVGN